MSVASLAGIVIGFRNGLLGKRRPTDMCRVVCLPLESYLRVEGYDTIVVEGTVEGWDHCWLRLADGRIIDPTADQFGNGMPKVYIGTLPVGYKEKPCEPPGYLKGPLATVLVARVKALRKQQAERQVNGAPAREG